MKQPNVNLTLLTFFSACHLLVICFPSWAESVEKDEDLRTIYIHSAKNTDNLEASSTSRTLITKQMIESSGAQDIEHLLNGFVGIDITQTGPRGSQASLFVRGTNSNHTKILINGVAVNTATTDSGNLNQLNIKSIEQIEIIRGARANLYGANTIGGVINIITVKKPQNKSANMSVGAGNNESYLFNLNGQTRIDQNDFSGGFTDTTTKGENATDQKLALTAEDKDGIHQEQAEFHWRNQGAIASGADFVHQQGLSEYDDGNTFLSSGSEGETDFRQDVLSAFTQLPLSENFSTKLAASFFESKDKSTSSDYDVANQYQTSTYQTQRVNVSVENSWRASDSHQYFLGVETEKEKADITSPYFTLQNNDERNNLGAFIMGDHVLLKEKECALLSTQWSVRTDDNDSFQRFNSVSLGVGSQITEAYFTGIQYGTAFRAPNFNELYATGTYSRGNPNLTPEESESFEWKHLWKAKAQSLELALFKTRISDLIVSAFTPDAAAAFGGYYIPDNISSAQIKGAEASWKYAAYMSSNTQWQNMFNVTWLKPEDEQTSLLLPRRAQRLFKYTTSYALGQHIFGYNLTAESRRFDDKQNTQSIPGFAIAGFNYQYHLDQDKQISFDLQNAFDHKYETISGYFMERRTFLISWTQSL